MFVLISVVIAMWMLLNEQRKHKPKSFLRFNEINVEEKRKWEMSSKWVIYVGISFTDVNYNGKEWNELCVFCYI